MDRLVIRHNASEVAEALRKAGQRAIVEIDTALGRGAVEVANEARERAPKFRSELTNRIGPERISPFEHHVVAASRHAVFAEAGTGPGGRPSLADMLDWIRLRGLTPRATSTHRSLAALLRKRIAERGTPAQPFAGPALEATTPRVLMLLREASRRAMERLA